MIKRSLNLEEPSTPVPKVYKKCRVPKTCTLSRHRHCSAIQCIHSERANIPCQNFWTDQFIMNLFISLPRWVMGKESYVPGDTQKNEMNRKWKMRTPLLMIQGVATYSIYRNSTLNLANLFTPFLTLLPCMSLMHTAAHRSAWSSTINGVILQLRGVSSSSALIIHKKNKAEHMGSS